jgi:putative endonuclease
MTGFLYILRCYDDRLYIGSTINLEKRIEEHNAGEGANFTKDRLPVTLIYFEKYFRIEGAFHREKQIQRWSQAKKEALIASNIKDLKNLAECKNSTHHLRIK